MLALTFRTDTAEEPVLLDPLTGRRYDFEEAGLPDGLREFLLAMAWNTPEGPQEERAAALPGDAA